MYTSLTKLAIELEEIVEWQRTPEVVEHEDYVRMIERAFKRMLIDTGRAAEFDDNKIHKEDTVYVDFDLKIDEQAYMLICAQLDFFKKVQTDVNNIVGYTTDALTVTNADKPYAHLQDTINHLEQERRITYYKMVRYCL